MQPPLRLGTRGSPLALVQARLVADALCAAHGWDEHAILIVPIRTTGDRVQDRPLADIGGKSLWTKELDRALLAREIDIAVHSMKDVETIRPAGIAIAAMLPRADVRDRIVGAGSIAALPHGARVGTSSPRRAAQLRQLRADLVPVPFRGNVDTRLARLAAGEAEATLLAAAGLDRLGRGDVGAAVPVTVMLPAPAQGAVGIEARADAAGMLDLLHAIDDRDTSAAVMAERALLAALGGTCRSPIAALARIAEDGLRIDAEILAPDGGERRAAAIAGRVGDAAIPARLAAELLDAASPGLRALFGR